MVQVLDLGGEWQLAVKDRPHETLPAQVPGDVFADLLAAEKIVDPFYRDNENQLQWIGESDWIYSRSFVVEKSLLEREHVILRCKGLDTMASVSINGRPLGSADNMFRVWEWEVKPLLVPGVNLIFIEFTSTIPYIEARQQDRPIPWGGQGRSKQKVACHGWVRKEQCNYGWDWGIKAVTCGIWRPIELLSFDIARIADLRISQSHDGNGNVSLTVGTTVVRTLKTAAELIAEVEAWFEGECVASGTANLANAADKAAVAFDVPNPQLWWPNNMGAQPLYEIKIELRDSGGSKLDADSRRIGLRTLRLDRHEDQWGESFQFTVNGLPFFTKGANWIPADGILGRMTAQRYRKLVEDAATANMNMLRVWGGGIYEDDSFYQACDELGVCIWQDFMFACSTYPTFDDGFMLSVKAEARDNIRRLRHHPCLALWCGNNELEQGLVGSRGWDNGQMPWDEYRKLFDKLLPGLVAELDDDRDYWPGSPHSPRGDREDFNNPTCGDAHLWAVWHGRQPFEWYRTCEHRFNSEFGFQSFPEPKTVYAYTEKIDRNITSWVMEHHQRSGIGNTTIMQYMLDWFRLPQGFENILWVSQILQGMAMKYACEHWRRSMPRGMGTLYWQLNDTWPVASWSSIDYFGRWKALHFMARNFFAPLLVSGVANLETGTVDIHATSDLLHDVSANLSWRVTDLKGAKLASGGKSCEVKRASSRCIEKLALKDLLSRYGERNLLVWLELHGVGQPNSRNLVLFARPKHLELEPNPGIGFRVEDDGGDGAVVTLQTRYPALWCRLEARETDTWYSDNFFHLQPGETMGVEVKLLNGMSVEQFRDQLVVSTLADTY